jgi:hypothetical protein
MRVMVVGALLWAAGAASSAAQEQGAVEPRDRIEAEEDAAESESWLVLPTIVGVASAWVAPTAASFADELAHRQTNVRPLDTAVEVFEAEQSAPPAELTRAEMQEWEERSDAAIRPLAREDYAEALGYLDEAQELSRRAPEDINRTRAQRMLDTCLYMVRALVETGSESLGSRLTRECRQLVLVGTPTPMMHPPKVLAMLSRVDEDRASQTGSIAVRSEPSNCTVRVNGVALGETPFDLEGVFPGRYRVQTECTAGKPSRVYFADVGLGRTEILIDSRFDAAIESRPLLLLQYATEPDESKHAPTDMMAVAKTLRSANVLWLHQTNETTLEARVVRGGAATEGPHALLRADPRGPSQGDVALAARALLDDRCVDLTELEPKSIPCKGSSEAEPAALVDGRAAQRMPRGMFISGLSLIGAGGASLLASGFLWIPRRNAGEDFVRNARTLTNEDTSSQQTWANYSVSIVTLSAIGGSMLTAAMPLALPKKEKAPWWAWMSGGLGLGLAALSVAIGVTQTDPEPSSGCLRVDVDGAQASTCVRRQEAISGAVAAGALAAPALAVPLTYLLRRGDKKLTPALEVSRAHARLTIGGRF